jgi:hypothetical protein
MNDIDIVNLLKVVTLAVATAAWATTKREGRWGQARWS